MVLVLHFFSSFFATVDELKKCLVAEEDDRSHFLMRLYGNKNEITFLRGDRGLKCDFDVD